jgi:hypothetical protein
MEREEFNRLTAGALELKAEMAAQYATAFDFAWLVAHILTPHHTRELYREFARTIKDHNFPDRQCREFKEFYAKLAAKHYNNQLILDREYGAIS